MVSSQLVIAQIFVSPGDGTLSQAITDAQAGDVLQLVPEGLYTESTNTNFGTVTGMDITIEVEEGTTGRAIIQILTVPNSENPTNFIQLSNGSSITLRGLELNGSLNGNASVSSLINFYMGDFPASTTINKIRIENCFIHDLTDHVIKTGNSDMRGYVIVDSTLVDDVIMQNTGTTIYYKYAGANYISLTNSTINTISSYGLRIAGPGETTMPDYTPEVVIDHTTWYNIGSAADAREILQLEKGPNLKPWTVTNSIFVKQYDKTRTVINLKDTTGDSLATVMNICLWDVGKTSWRSHVVVDTITMDPQFTDPDNGDFTLPEGSLLLTFGTDGKAIGDPRWATNAPSAVNSQTGTVPATFTLSQNYPNPFNPITHITFTIDNTGPTMLSVFDVAGREVAVLVNDLLPAGEYNVAFNAGQFTSGMYVYRLTYAGRTLNKKMLLVR